MFTATKGKILPTTITGSLPRPSWFVENLRGRDFLAAMGGDFNFNEQYSDAVAAMIADQHRAGLDILSDGEMRFDTDIGGRSWFGYLFDRMEGLAKPQVRRSAVEWAARTGPLQRPETPGDILHEVLQTKMPPVIEAPIGPGRLQYDAVWKVAQRHTRQPIKMGSCCGQMIEKHVVDQFYKNREKVVMALSEALNKEYHRLADAGCQVIQVEEPLLHYAEGTEWGVSNDFYVKALNAEVKGLREKTEVWCHTCWGNPFAQRVEAGYSYKPVLRYLEQLDVDVVTFETADNRGAEIPEIAAAIGKDKKICIGVVSHRTLQVELPDEVAELIRKALKHVPPERLVLSSDCGFGRQGMSRVHALYKMAAIVRGANIVRKELGLPTVDSPILNRGFSLI